MGRTRASAKSAGRAFERIVAQYLGGERRRQAGAKDRGDVAGVNVGQYPLVVECKNTTRIQLPEWWKEAVRECDAEVAYGDGCGFAYTVVVHKRHGKSAPEDQWVTMDLAEFRSLLGYVNELYEKTQNTGRLVDAIKQIAEQTDVLDYVLRKEA